MKKLNLSSFLSGIGLTLIVFSIFAFTKNNEAEIKTDNAINSAPPVVTVSSETAIQYRNNYKAVNPGSIEGINISLEQLDAINQTISSMNNDLREVSGFRLYFGATSPTSSAPVVSIAYILNKQYKQNPASSNLFMAEGFNNKYKQQCPPFCD
jgi:hypothetical protein